MDINTVKNLFINHNGIMRTYELTQNGIHYRSIHTLIQKAMLKKFAMAIISGWMTVCILTLHS